MSVGALRATTSVCTGYEVKLYLNSLSGPLQSTQTVTGLSMFFSGLTPGATYAVSVVALDAAGNRSTPLTGTVTTASLNPSVPSHLVVTSLSSDRLTLCWNAPDSGATITDYIVNRNGTNYDIGSANPWYLITGLSANTAYTLKVEAVYGSGGTSGWSDSLTVSTIPPLATLGPVTFPTATGSLLVPSPGGEVAVDNHGAANYSVPLKIVPGRGGMTPQLALQYNSSAGNGVVGVGWSLSTGFPGAITRGRSILARDGIVKGVTFNDGGISQDYYYLDRRRLVCVSSPGTYGLPGSVYRTEVDSFQQIVATGSGNIETFVATDRSGVKYTFGKTSDSTDGFQKGGGETGEIAYSFALKRVEDMVGNYVTFTYAFLGNGEYVLSRIDYTGNSLGSGVPPAAHVDFAYDGTRPDQPVTYQAGRSFSHRARLAMVTAKTLSGGSDVTASCYTLDYECPLGLAGGRSRLTRITPYLADPVSHALCLLHYTMFAWNNFEQGISADPVYAGNLAYDFPYSSDGAAFAFGADANGKDGISAQSSFDDTMGRHNYLCDRYGHGRLDIAQLSGLAPDPGTPPGFGGTLFFDPSSPSTWFLAAAEGSAVASRVTLADYSGEGRDDMLVHSFDGHLYLFKNQGGTWSQNPQQVSGVIGGYGNILDYKNNVLAWNMWSVYQSNDRSVDWSARHFWVNPMPCDLNGDGRTDYVFTNSMRSAFSSVPTVTLANNYFCIRSLVAVLSKPDGTFSNPVTINQYAPYFAGALYPANPDIKQDDVNVGAFPGDFNGDGLTDFLVLDNKNILYRRWVLYLSKGQSADGSPLFEMIPGPIPNTVNIGGYQVHTYYNPALGTSLGYPVGIFEHPNSPDVPKAFMAMESASASTNTFVWDVNGDGLADLVWYVDRDVNDNPLPANVKGWYVMLSQGQFTQAGSANGQPSDTHGITNGTGFSAPMRLDFLNVFDGGQPYPDSYLCFTAARISHNLDFDGDGHPDFWYQKTYDGVARTSGYVYAARDAHGTSPPPFGDTIKTVTDGLGRTTTIAYKAAKDNSIYTPGAPVSYPIREMFTSNPVVSDVYQDTGSDSQAQFSYQYSGNRLDLSGRGSLGFHSFITLDRQTNLFKYQFLTQSFPMTGLTSREQTFRYWADTGNVYFRTISSHDNTVVFDEVSDGLGGYGTVYPFISQATEYRWEDSNTAHFSWPKSSPNPPTPLQADQMSSPELLFSSYNANRPGGNHIAITAQSLFDSQTSVQTSLPLTLTSAGYNPSDINSSWQAVPAGTTSYSIFDSLPRKITYGNLTQLYTNYGDGFTETVNTTYASPATINGVTTLTGRPSSVKTTVISPVGGTQVAPVKNTTQYFTASNGNQTALPMVETVDASQASPNANANLSLTTTYTRDGLGRITSTAVSGTDLQYTGQGPVSYTVSSVPAYDSRFDLPTSQKDAYGHTTLTGYDTYLGLPTSVTDPNGYVINTTYDALGRVIDVNDPQKGADTTTTYGWDTSQPVAPPSGVTGLSLTSAYSVTTQQTCGSVILKPPTTTYNDRLARTIRTIKTGFNNQQAVTDTCYNNLGQVVAASLPYPSGGTACWTKTTYDPLGRVVTATAPNETVTTNAYKGRITQVTVAGSNASSLSSSGWASQTNTTLGDAKGRTVAVWNADNQPVLSLIPGSDAAYTASTSTASIAFALDGFGLMRTTALKGQTPTITATYDALGHQVALNDPDKGNWTYVNNPFGDVLTQTNARGDVTQSTYDRLRRQITRIMTEAAGPAETANWYYYDTAANVSNYPHLVDKANQGWIGAPAREEVIATGASGYSDPGTKSVHYYDSIGRPHIDLSTIDGKYFYTTTNYDPNIPSHVAQIHHYWRPPTHEAPGDLPYLWNDFGYAYTYDNNSYLLKIQDTTGAGNPWWEADGAAGYDYLDRPVIVRMGNGYWTQRTYDPKDGLLTGITTGNGSVQNLSFTYDGLGDLTIRNDTLHGRNESFGYDVLNRLAFGPGAANYLDNGNISSKTDVSGAAVSGYTYGGARPHAVTAVTTGGATINIDYDADGNLLTRSGGGSTWSMNWTGFDKPRWMAKTTASAVAGSEFHYNAARSRVMHLDFDSMSGSGSSATPLHYTLKRLYALGSTMEVDYKNKVAAGATPAWQLDKVRIYVPGPDGVVGTMEFSPFKQFAPFGGSSTSEQNVVGNADAPERMLVYHYDHLGSIESITPYGDTSTHFAFDENGRTSRFSYEPWGQRRDPVSWSGAPSATDSGGPTGLTPRGFTGHEMLDNIGLVHMNGRIYDPLLGRFLSADLLVSNPANLQSFNRYSYVGNNPLSTTDPSGFESQEEQWKRLVAEQRGRWKKHDREVAAAAHGHEVWQNTDPPELMDLPAKLNPDDADKAADDKASSAAEAAQPAPTPNKNISAIKPKDGSKLQQAPPTAQGPNSGGLPTPTDAQISDVLQRYQEITFHGSASEKALLARLLAQADLFRRPINGNQAIAMRTFNQRYSELYAPGSIEINLGFGSGDRTWSEEVNGRLEIHSTISRTTPSGRYLQSDGQMVVSMMHELLQGLDFNRQMPYIDLLDRQNEVVRMHNQTLHDLNLPLDSLERGVGDYDKYFGPKW